jgi:hypothetical protein
MMKTLPSVRAYPVMDVDPAVVEELVVVFDVVMLAVEVFVDVGEVFVLETVLDLVEVLNVVLVVVALTDVDVVDVVLAVPGMH